MLATLGHRRFDVTHDVVVVAPVDEGADPVTTAAGWPAPPDAVLLTASAPASAVAATVGGWRAVLDVPVIVRTTDASVVAAALDAGASAAHDPSGAVDAGYLRSVVDREASVVLGSPAVPPVDPAVRASDLVALADAAVAAGVRRDRVVVDVTRGAGVAPRDTSLLGEVVLVARAGWPVMVTVTPDAPDGGWSAPAAHAVVVPRGARILASADPRTTRRVAGVVAELLRARDAGQVRP